MHLKCQRRGHYDNKEDKRARRLNDVGRVNQIVWMKCGKAFGDMMFQRDGSGFLTRLFNTILKNERVPEQWRSSMLIQVFQSNCDVQSYSTVTTEA